MSCGGKHGTLGLSSRALSAARTVCHRRSVGAGASITVIIGVVLSWGPDNREPFYIPWAAEGRPAKLQVCFMFLPTPLS